MQKDVANAISYMGSRLTLKVFVTIVVVIIEVEEEEGLAPRATTSSTEPFLRHPPPRKSARGIHHIRACISCWAESTRNALSCYRNSSFLDFRTLAGALQAHVPPGREETVVTAHKLEAPPRHVEYTYCVAFICRIVSHFSTICSGDGLTTQYLVLRHRMVLHITFGMIQHLNLCPCGYVIATTTKKVAQLLLLRVVHCITFLAVVCLRPTSSKTLLSWMQAVVRTTLLRCSWRFTSVTRI